MGFFKRIKRQVSRSFRKVEKQLQRTPLVGEALREVSRVTERAERAARRARGPVALGLATIAPIFGPFAPITAAAAGIIGARVGRRSAKDAAKAAKRFQLELQRSQGVPFFGSLLSGLGSLSQAATPSFFSQVGSFLGKAATSIGSQIAQPLLGAVVQKGVQQIVGRPRAPTGFVPSFTGAAVGGLPGITRATPTPQQFFRNNGGTPPMGGGRMPRGGFDVPGVFANIPQGRGQVFENMPKGSDRLRPVLTANGTIAWVLQPRRRRMNVLNPRALNRAIRRVDGFAKSVMRSRKSLRRIKTV